MGLGTAGHVGCDQLPQALKMVIPRTNRQHLFISRCSNDNIW